MPRSYRHSAATLELAALGVRQREIAAAMGNARSLVSLICAGKSGRTPEFDTAIRALAGPENAQRILHLVDQAAAR